MSTFPQPRLASLSACQEDCTKHFTEANLHYPQQDSASSALDPLGSASGPHDASRALLDAATHLLAWAKTRWPEVVSYGLKDRLRFLWHLSLIHI